MANFFVTKARRRVRRVVDRKLPQTCILYLLYRKGAKLSTRILYILHHKLVFGRIHYISTYDAMHVQMLHVANAKLGIQLRCKKDALL